MKIKPLPQLFAYVVGFWALVVPILGSACEECEPDEFRCEGRTLEICDADGRWAMHTKCDEIWVPSDDSEKWTCCNVGDGPECLPQTECREE